MKLKHVLKKLFFSCLGILAFYSNTFAQGTMLKGKVVDNQNNPVPGVIVKIKETAKATTTDAGGAFSITYQGPSTLVVTSIGYVTREFHLTNQTTLDIK